MMNLRKYLRLLPISLVAFLMFNLNSVNAQTSNSFSISPPTFDINANPGDVIENTIKVENLSQSTLSLRVKPENFVAYGQGGQVNLTEEESSYSISSWLRFPVSEFTVLPGKTYLFSYKLDIPKNIEPGSHYGAIVFSNNPNAAQDGTGAIVVQEIGALILIRTPGEVKETADLISFSADKPVFTEPKAKLNALIENTGSVHFKMTGFITIYDLFGNKVKTIEISSKNVLPDSKRLFEEEFEFDGIGYYRASIDMFYGGGEKVLRADTVFYSLYLQRTVPILAALILILAVYLIFRKRINKAVKVILKG